MNDKKIDELFESAARPPQDLDPALLARLRNSMGPTIRPVRPLPPTWASASGLFVIGALVAIAGAAWRGFYGFADLGTAARVLIFLAIGFLLVLLSAAFTQEMIPASRHWLSAKVLLALACAMPLAIFALLFRDYHTEHFFSAGLVCLGTGLLWALPVGLLGSLLLRRGFAVNLVAAGAMGGTLAGLAGIAMLELHCNNFQALHILVWHTAVIPASAAAGGALGAIWRTLKAAPA